MIEIQPHVRFIIRIRKIIHPTCRIWINVDYITVQEIPFAGERPRNRTIHNTTVIINISRIFGDHDHLVRINFDICILIPFIRIQTIPTLGSFHIIKNLIIIVHLRSVQHRRTIDRMLFVYTLNRHQLIFRRLFPRNGFRPVQIWLDRITLPVFFDFISFITSVRRICQTFTDNRVAHPVHKLLVFRYRYFCLIHPKRLNRDFLCRHRCSPK